MSYKRSQLRKSITVRERPLTQQQRRNKRELEDLLEHTIEPLNKKRRVFTGNYFLGKQHKMKIDSYKEYLEYIQNWDNLTQSEHEELRKWYRDYYQKNKEKERKRYREYYSSNADLEKKRVKVSKILRHKLEKRDLSALLIESCPLLISK